VTDPLSYLDITRFETAAAAVATDSGGMQKEAYFYRVPCVTLRDETEWVETVTSGWNRLASPSAAGISEAILSAVASRPSVYPQPYGCGRAGEVIVNLLHRTPSGLPCGRVTSNDSQ